MSVGKFPGQAQSHHVLKKRLTNASWEICSSSLLSILPKSQPFQTPGLWFQKSTTVEVICGIRYIASYSNIFYYLWVRCTAHQYRAQILQRGTLWKYLSRLINLISVAIQCISGMTFFFFPFSWHSLGSAELGQIFSFLLNKWQKWQLWKIDFLKVRFCMVAYESTLI